jgi:hypothetical protein
MATKRPIHPGHEKFWEKQHIAAAGLHVTWQMSAAELRRAIDILYKHVQKNHKRLMRGKSPVLPDPSRICMMLSGLMLENLLKAVLVSRHGAFNRAGKFAHTGHDLLGFANRVDLKLSEEEAWLMERLTNFVEWAGRYPIL